MDAIEDRIACVVEGTKTEIIVRRILRYLSSIHFTVCILGVANIWNGRPH